MGMVEEVAGYIADSSTRFVAGTTLFVNAVPVSTGAVVALLESGGGPPAWVYSDGLPAWEMASLQVVARSTRPPAGASLPSSTTARSMIHDVWVILSDVANTTIDSSTYLRIEPVQSPMMLPGQEDDGRLTFTCNFDVWRRPSTAY